MPYCRKCGTIVDEEMTFCPKCGASLKAEQPRYVRERARGEKEEKHEKREKREKGEKTETREKTEKGEYAFIGPLIGGLILIFLGLTSYLQITGYFKSEILWALFFVLVGTIIIIAAIYATRRHPRP